MPKPVRLPLNTLGAFRAVAELGNLRKAAERIHLTHSAVSQQIRSLEEALGFEVFDRRGRRVALNAAGAALLRSVQAALAQLDDGVQAAAAAVGGESQRLRVTVLPSFANRWLLPRIARWRERHPNVALEIDASMRLVDLAREGFQAAIREGRGPWPGLESVRLFDQPPIVLVGSPDAARRLAGASPEALAREPLLGDADLWGAWFAANGLKLHVRTVAMFNDAGMMLQAAEQSMGLALSREMLAADALVDGSLVRLSPVTITHADAQPYHLCFPAALRDFAPLDSFRRWLGDELAASQRALRATEPPGRRRGAAKAGPGKAERRGGKTLPRIDAPASRRRRR